MILSALIFIITMVVTLAAIWICATLYEISELLKDQWRRSRMDAVRGEKLNPYSAADPRYYAYEQEYAANDQYKARQQDLQNVAAIRITKR